MNVRKIKNLVFRLFCIASAALGILILALSLAEVDPGSPRLVHSTFSLVRGRPAYLPPGTVAGRTNGFGAM